MIRNILAVIAGFVAGSVVNMGLINVNMVLHPPPAEIEPGSPEYAAYVGALPATAFAIVWLAHAGGAFVGGLVAAVISRTAKLVCAMIIGAFFLLGGIAMAFILPAPVLFLVLDLAAYLPAAYLGYWLGSGGSTAEAQPEPA